MEKEYLGDSVYAQFNGRTLILTTENGEGPSNAIWLAPKVLKNLANYVEKLNAKEHTQ